MRYLVDLEAKHAVEQDEVYLNAMQNPKNPLHDAVKEEKGHRLARGKTWIGRAEQSIQHVRSRRAQESKGMGKRPVEVKDYYKTLISENLDTHCRE